MHTSEPSARIYHNPRCSKSREALAILREHGVEPEVVLYLETELSARALKELVQRFGIEPHALLRTQEAAFKEAGLNEASELDAIVAAIRKAPILLERPIVIVGDRALIGRPPEKVRSLLQP